MAFIRNVVNSHKYRGSYGSTIRLDSELSHGANAGLKKITQLLEPLHKKYNISHGDL